MKRLMVLAVGLVLLGMGFSASAQQQLIPIFVSTNQDVYRAGDRMEVTGSLENPGPETTVDVYLGVGCPDWAGSPLFFLPWLDQSWRPYLSHFWLSQGWSSGDVNVFNYDFADDFPAGDYFWFAAVTEPDTTNVIGEISFAWFSFESDGGADFYVSTCGSDLTGDGSKDNPWMSIGYALEQTIAAPGNPKTIGVAAGTYEENIEMKSFVNLYGGYSALDWERDIELNETIIDGGGDGHVVIGADDSTIDGFTITNGRTGEEGGGINCMDSSPTIRNCTITGNSTDSSVGGAGIFCKNSTAMIQNCTIMNNYSDNTEYGSGGGIYCWYGSPTIQNCTISGNSAEYYTGGGIYCADSTAIIENCTIDQNSARWGGGICWFRGAPTIRNCMIAGNSAGDTGGALWCEDSTAVISNCTVSQNAATSGGGGSYFRQHSGISPMPTITDCIFWANESNVWDEATVTYCDVENDMPEGEGNLSEDPKFRTGPFGEYYLAPDSPCIDAGSKSAVDAGLSDRTTMEDGVADTDMVDLGYHYPMP